MFRRIGRVLDRVGWLIAIVFLGVGFVVLHDQSVKLGNDSKRIGEQTMSLEALSAQNGTLIVTLEAEVARERSRAIQAADAYCRLKHYETLSGGAVLRIAAGFHLLSSRAQARWRVALERVAQIPAASSCSGTPVGLRRPPSRPEDRSLVSQGEALVAPSVGAPIIHRPPAHHPHVTPPSRHTTPQPAPRAPSIAPPPLPPAAPSPPSPPPHSPPIPPAPPPVPVAPPVEPPAHKKGPLGLPCIEVAHIEVACHSSRVARGHP